MRMCFFFYFTMRMCFFFIIVFVNKIFTQTNNKRTQHRLKKQKQMKYYLMLNIKTRNVQQRIVLRSLFMKVVVVLIRTC